MIRRALVIIGPALLPTALVVGAYLLAAAVVIAAIVSLLLALFIYPVETLVVAAILLAMTGAVVGIRAAWQHWERARGYPPLGEPCLCFILLTTLCAGGFAVAQFERYMSMAIAAALGLAGIAAVLVLLCVWIERRVRARRNLRPPVVTDAPLRAPRRHEAVPSAPGAAGV